jgi:hypothetical protein
MALMENRCDIKNRMAQRLASYKERLTAQFDELFPRNLVGSRHAYRPTESILLQDG